MVKAFYSTVYDAPIQSVWSQIRAFDSLGRWHPAVGNLTIEEGLASDTVGAVRRFDVEGAGEFRERLVGLSDHDRTITYTILKTPAPWTNYVATIQLYPVKDGDRTFASWSATFDCPAGTEDEFADMVSNGVFKSGLDALHKHLGSAAAPKK